MKTTIEIVGVGERRQGTTKAGKPYDFVTVAFTFQDKNVEGLNAANCLVNGSEVDANPVYPGTRCEALILYRNYQPYIAAFL